MGKHPNRGPQPTTGRHFLPGRSWGPGVPCRGEPRFNSETRDGVGAARSPLPRVHKCHEGRGAGRKLPGPSPSSSPLRLPPGRPGQSPTRSRVRAQTGRCWGEEDIRVGDTVRAGTGGLFHTESLMPSVTRPRTMGARTTTVRKGRTKAPQYWIRSGGSSENSRLSTCGCNRCANTHTEAALCLHGGPGGSTTPTRSIIRKDLGF